MLLKNFVQVELNPQPRYLENAILMEDDRVAVITSKLNPEEAEIFIYGKDNKLLYTHRITTEVFYQACGTINRHELFYLLPGCGQWGILNIRDFTERRGKFDFICPRPFRSRVHFFPESKTICIWEIGDFQDKPGRLTFLPYPSDPPGNDREPWQIKVDDIFNHVVLPLNLRNRIALYAGKVEDKIRWSVYDFDTREVTKHEVNKPENNGEYCLKHVAELKEGTYLLSIEAMKPEFRYMIYDESKKGEQLKAFPIAFDDKTFQIMSLGPWLYVFEFNVDANGTQLNAPLRVISKETHEQVFQDECFIGANVEYFLGSTNDQYILRVDCEHHNTKKVRVETLRATSQRELYVHLLKQRSSKKMTVDMIQYVLDAFEEE